MSGSTAPPVEPPVEPLLEISISYLNALEYCPRRFYYEFVQGEMLRNEFVLEGTLLHERADEPGHTNSPDGKTHYSRIYLRSEQYGLNGFADLIEEQAGQLLPVEYKHGKQGRWLNDHVQLCAQALCLEEQEHLPVEYGYIFYWGSRRRVRVDFTDELRQHTLQRLTQARELCKRETPPAPLEAKAAARCRDCSLQPLCLLEEVRLLQNKAGAKKSVAKGGDDLADLISDRGPDAGTPG